jgi:hypothetical protein
MSLPKTLVLDIAKNPHLIQDSIGVDPGQSAAEVDERIDAKLVDYVKIADIVNNLITENPNKPLSAAQGVELKAQIDALKADITKIVVEGMGIAAGLGVKVTVENATTLIHIDIDEDSPLAFNENNKLTLQWNENE